jgi:hypothetical protein
MQTPSLKPLCDLVVELDPIMPLGAGRAGERRIIPIVGGSVRGERINGRILNIGADWQTVFADGCTQLDTRYAMQTDDGALIEIINFGYRHGPEQVMQGLANGEDISFDDYYMRTHARLETGDERYRWLNKQLFIGTGGRRKTRVELRLFEVC